MNVEAQASKEKLLADMKMVVGDAEELLRATANQAGEKVEGLRRRVQENLVAARARIAETELGLMDRAKAAVNATDEYVRAHPWQSIGIAAGAAFLIGIFLGRR